MSAVTCRREPGLERGGGHGGGELVRGRERNERVAVRDGDVSIFKTVTRVLVRRHRDIVHVDGTNALWAGIAGAERGIGRPRSRLLLLRSLPLLPLNLIPYCLLLLRNAL